MEDFSRHESGIPGRPHHRLPTSGPTSGPTGGPTGGPTSGPTIGQRGGPRATLSLLGLSADDELVYRVLLRNSPVAVDDLSEMVGRLPEELRALADRLRAAGLAIVRGDEIEALPPGDALGGLISAESRRLRTVREQLDSLREALPSLVVDHMAATVGQRTEQVAAEVVEGGDIAGLIRTLSESSTGDLMWMRPDQWRLPVTRDIDDWVKRLVGSGRRSRAIYPARVLEEAPEVIRSRAAAGEHVRIVAEVPCRVAIMGTSAALLPDRWGVNTGRRVVIREEVLVCALTAFFESMWERAVAVPGLDGQLDGDDRDDERRLLLDQLASGAKDEQIARALGMSVRTVRRRVADILDDLGVASRFQAGVEAVRRGWI